MATSASGRQRSSPPSKRPSLSPKGEGDRQARVEREAAALRENLHKRKAQARARAEVP